MSDAISPAIFAIVVASVVALLLFIPFITLQYRRRGALGFGAVALSFGMLVYAFALISYTLLPLPEVTPDFCSVYGSDPQLVPGQFVADILRESNGGLAGALRAPATLQVLLNIALFVPLGMFLRHVFRRGVLVVGLIGLLVSALIEFTQLTGAWFLYPCSYRLFDVDDLLANTLGALIGVVAAPLLRLVPGQRMLPAEAPRRVTVGRRLLGMIVDLAAVYLLGGVLSAVYSIVLLLIDRDPNTVDDVSVTILSIVVPALVQLLIIARSRRTLGEWAVRLHPATESGGVFVRWLIGIGGYTLLGVLPLGAFAQFLLGAATLVIVFTSRGHRGLAYAAARWDLIDDRMPTRPE